MSGEKRDIITLCGKTFLSAPVIDTSIDVCIYDIAENFAAIKNKIVKLYGNVKVIADGVETDILCAERADAVEIKGQKDFDKERYNAADAVRIIARLARDGDGCPWDRVQTHESIRINMIEEAYEAVDAIDKRDVANMREEFGDVFLQSVLQSDIARRAGEFDFDDVCDELCKKLIGRHTFIFGGDSASNADDALTLWEKAKSVEKHYDSVKTQLNKLPDNFPSLLLCQKTHKKLKKIDAAGDPESEFKTAADKRDYVGAIAAAAAALADEGKDAEVELNRVVKDKIRSL